MLNWLIVPEERFSINVKDVALLFDQVVMETKITTVVVVVVIILISYTMKVIFIIIVIIIINIFAIDIS